MGKFGRNEGLIRRGTRRWSFADCIFDESNWTLSVVGQRVAIETKPLELLRQLLINAQQVVSKGELMDAVWPDVAVVEASLPTAMRKLRNALSDDQRSEHIIETVPRIGYRVMIPVSVEERPCPSAAAPVFWKSSADRQPAGKARRRHRLAGIGLVAALVMFSVALAPSEHVSAITTAQLFSQREVITALHRMDLAKIDAMLAAGWKPEAPVDAERNNALDLLLDNCEWNPDHDRLKMRLIARTLLDGGVQLVDHNVWGDTPYSIANAKRFCGPDHPVTRMIRRMCYAGGKPVGDRCLATYELNRRPA